MAFKIAFVNQKGGVGKTSIAYNLSYCFSQQSIKTLLVDVDPSRNATKPYCHDFAYSIKDILEDKNFDPYKAIYSAKLNNEKEITNLSIIPSHVSLAILDGKLSSVLHKEKLLKKQIEKIEKNFDIILFDLPPMLSIFSVNAIYVADLISICVRYEKDALEGITDLFNVTKEIKEDQFFDYKIIRNGFDGRKKTVNAFACASLEEFEKINKVFKTFIRQDEEINKAKMADYPVLKFSPKSCGSEDYVNLSKEISELMNEHKTNL